MTAENGCVDMKNNVVFDSTRLNQYMRGKEAVGIFELAELLGVTSEALRKYESKEIIQPIRDQRGYRKYHSWDLTKIICARQMRQEGFSLNDVSDGMKNNDAQCQMAMIEQMQKTLMQEILYRQKLIHRLALQRDEVMRSEQTGDRCVIEHLPALHCCVYMVDDTLVNKTGEKREQLRRWFQALPFINVCYVGVPHEKILSCLVLTEEEMHVYEMDDLEPDFVIPQQCYAVCYAVAEHDDVHDTSDASVMSAFRRAESLNMKLESYVVSRMIRYVQRAGTFASVNKMCFPIWNEQAVPVTRFFQML